MIYYIINSDGTKVNIMGQKFKYSLLLDEIGIESPLNITGRYKKRKRNHRIFGPLMSSFCLRVKIRQLYCPYARQPI